MDCGGRPGAAPWWPRFATSGSRRVLYDGPLHPADHGCQPLRVTKPLTVSWRASAAAPGHRFHQGIVWVLGVRPPGRRISALTPQRSSTRTPPLSTPRSTGTHAGNDAEVTAGLGPACIDRCTPSA